MTAIFIASLTKKTYLAVSSSYLQWVDFFVNVVADRKDVVSTPKYFLFA